MCVSVKIKIIQMYAYVDNYLRKRASPRLSSRHKSSKTRVVATNSQIMSVYVAKIWGSNILLRFFSQTMRKSDVFS